MNYFYGTFMMKQAFKSMFVKIYAENHAQADECMHSHFGVKFMTVYDEDNFAGQEDEYGLECMCVIKVIDHGSSIEYKLI